MSFDSPLILSVSKDERPAQCDRQRRPSIDNGRRSMDDESLMGAALEEARRARDAGRAQQDVLRLTAHPERVDG